MAFGIQLLMMRCLDAQGLLSSEEPWAVKRVLTVREDQLNHAIGAVYHVLKPFEGS